MFQGEPFCPQGPDASTRINTVNQTGASEDCLFLNVYSPSNATGPLPVLVWIHGGGYGGVGADGVAYGEGVTEGGEGQEEGGDAAGVEGEEPEWDDDAAE